jgi:alkylglycerol monooxygenase
MTMSQFNYLAFAIPAFFIFLFLEYLLAIHLNKLHVFKYESSVLLILVTDLVP